MVVGVQHFVECHAPFFSVESLHAILHDLFFAVMIGGEDIQYQFLAECGPVVNDKIQVHDKELGLVICRKISDYSPTLSSDNRKICKLEYANVCTNNGFFLQDILLMVIDDGHAECTEEQQYSRHNHH